MLHIFLIHSPVRKYFGGFSILALFNDIKTKTGMRIVYYIIISWLYYLNWDYWIIYSHFIFSFWKDFHAVLHNGSTNTTHCTYMKFKCLWKLQIIMLTDYTKPRP